MPERGVHRKALELYLRLGPGRSIQALHDALTADPSRCGLSRAPALRSLYAWSSRFRWQERIAELEDQAAEANRDAWQAAIREMNERQAKLALAVQQKAVQALADIDPASIEFSDAVHAIVESARLERLARGEATERNDVQGGLTHEHQLRAFSDEELLRLLDAVEDLAARAEPPPAR